VNRGIPRGFTCTIEAHGVGLGSMMEGRQVPQAGGSTEPNTVPKLLAVLKWIVSNRGACQGKSESGKVG